MATAAHSHHQTYQPSAHSHLGLAGVDYETDDAGPGGSPLMKPYIPKIAPSPSPPLGIPAAKVSLRSPSIDGFYQSNRHKIRHSTGDAVLVSYLDNGRHPEIARAAGYQDLATSDDFADSDYDSDNGDHARRHLDNQRRAIEGEFYRPEPSGLQQVAAGALQQVASREPAHDISVSTRKLSLVDNGPVLAVHAPSPTVGYPPRRDQSFGRVNTSIGGHKSSPEMLTPASGELPPLQMDSPRYDGNGQSLPSIRSQFGNLPSLHGDKDLPRPAGPGSLFSRSPSAGIPRLHPPMSQAGQVSPPTSPNDTYSRGPSSATSPYSYGGSSLQHRPSTDYSSSTAGETPSTDQSVSTPATSVADRMSIDGITNPSQSPYVCTVPGCNAPPFQTQYLLNSHANVHSSARPHYCPVAGCPRGETGKGFKRKNEMIRHGLVHESPGYVCPFCPERDHKYPRPDNLQRCVAKLDTHPIQPAY
jgi:hypothetical protein